MNLALITTIKTPSSDAQSIQVFAMAKAFNLKLPNNFIFVSSETTENADIITPYRWLKITGSSKSRLLRYVKMLLVMPEIIKKNQITHIYTRDIGVAVVAKILKKNAVYEIHKPFETSVGKIIFYFLKNYIKIVAISEALKDFLVKNYKLIPNKILVAHDGVFLENFSSLNTLECRQKIRSDLNLVSDAFVVMYSGNLHVQGKGVELIIESARRLSHCMFVVIGGNNYGDNIPFNIRFVPRVAYSEIARYLKVADVLLLPFTRELKTWRYHSALKMFEYMASGVPVLASRLGSITEILNDNNSILFDPNSVEDFVKKIDEISKKQVEVKQLAKQALLDVKQYDWGERVQKVLNFIK